MFLRHIRAASILNLLCAPIMPICFVNKYVIYAASLSSYGTYRYGYYLRIHS